MQRIHKPLRASPFLTNSTLKYPIHLALRLAVPWQLVGAPDRAPISRRRTPDVGRSRVFSDTHAESPTGFSRQILLSALIARPPLFAPVDEPALNSDTVCLSSCRLATAPASPVSMGKGPWTRARAVAAAASSRVCVTALHSGSVDGSNQLGWISPARISLLVPRLIVVSIALHGFSRGLDSVRVRMRPPRIRAVRIAPSEPGVCRYRTRRRDGTRASRRPFCIRQRHVSGDEGGPHAPWSGPRWRSFVGHVVTPYHSRSWQLRCASRGCTQRRWQWQAKHIS